MTTYNRSLATALYWIVRAITALVAVALRAIAWVLAVMALSEPLVVLALPERLHAPLGLENGSIDPGGLFAALVVLVLAEVFREGVHLREDNERTI